LPPPLAFEPKKDAEPNDAAAAIELSNAFGPNDRPRRDDVEAVRKPVWSGE